MQGRERKSQNHASGLKYSCMTPSAPNPESYPRTPSPKSELTAAPACFEGLAQALRWLELRQMQPHSWQVFSGSSLMWRSAWYCFLHWCLPPVCGRKCPCAWQPLGLTLGLQPAARTAQPLWRSLCYTLKRLLSSSGCFLVTHIAQVLSLRPFPMHASNIFHFCHFPSKAGSYPSKILQPLDVGTWNSFWKRITVTFP